MLDRSSLVEPGSPAAEAFRTLRLALQLRDRANKRALAFTSAEEGAGKSTVAANLALLAALSRGRTLLLDADLRRPVVHGIFGVSRSPGLIELLASTDPITEFTQRASAVASRLEHLELITAGRPISRVGEVITSHRMVEVVREAIKAYDSVVIDTPPIRAAADAEAIATIPGVEVVLVVDRKTSRQRSVARAIKRLEAAGAEIAGLVYNHDTDSPAHYAYGD